MLSIGVQKIFLFRQPVDMRKSFDGLSGLVEQAFPGQLQTGSLFVFINRRRHMIKILCWDGDGMMLWHKRLEAGTYKIPESSNNEVVFDRRQLMALLEGIIPKKIRSRYGPKQELERRRKFLQNCPQ